jgi:hypothetical protein
LAPTKNNAEQREPGASVDGVTDATPSRGPEPFSFGSAKPHGEAKPTGEKVPDGGSRFAFVSVGVSSTHFAQIGADDAGASPPGDGEVGFGLPPAQKQNKDEEFEDEETDSAAGEVVDPERRAEVLELYPPFELLHYDLVEAIPPAYIAPVEPLFVAPVPRKTLQLRYEKDQHFIILLETEWLLFARTKWGLSPFANPDADPNVEYTLAEEALLNRVELASGQLYNVCHLHPFMGKPLSHRKRMLEIAFAELVRAVDLLKK